MGRADTSPVGHASTCSSHDRPRPISDPGRREILNGGFAEVFSRLPGMKNGSLVCREPGLGIRHNDAPPAKFPIAAMIPRLICRGAASAIAMGRFGRVVVG